LRLRIRGREGTTFRAEGELRERQGRFSREHWDGATAALPEYLYSDETPRILTTPRASAYIKIAEGCDHPCSFCIIPQLRGKFRSRRLESIVAEAEKLIAQGVREITLIGQDTTCYGEDLGLKDGLSDAAGIAGGAAGLEVAAVSVCVSEQGDDAAAGDDGAARERLRSISMCRCNMRARAC
jgi:ribosomal protein S12 methylthiotransferase